MSGIQSRPGKAWVSWMPSQLIRPFILHRLRMVRFHSEHSIWHKLPYEPCKHKNACFHRNRPIQKAIRHFQDWTFFGSLSLSIEQVSWLTDLHIFLSFSYKKLYNGFVRKYSLFTVTGSLRIYTWFPFPCQNSISEQALNTLYGIVLKYYNIDTFIRQRISDKHWFTVDLHNNITVTNRKGSLYQWNTEPIMNKTTWKISASFGRF